MKAVLKYAIVVAAGLLLAGCGYKVNYSLSGASIPPDAKTFSVAYFPNNAPMVAPILSSTLTDALRDKFTRQTRLTQVDEGGDFAFEGEITGYTSTTASVSGSSETALLNRLTITVNVRFTNAVDESMSWKKTFSAFEDFDSSKLLNEIEGELIPQIVDKLVTDIFQASAAARCARRALRVVYSRPYPARASNRAFRPSGVDRGGVASAAARTVHGRSGGALCAFACRPDRPFPEGGGASDRGRGGRSR